MKNILLHRAYPGAFAAFAFLLIAPDTVQAQTPPKQFFACYVPSSGVMYRIKEDGLKDACTGKKHIEFSWAELFADNDGKVGIGTTNPTAALDVAGDMRVTEGVRIGNTIFVFSLGASTNPNTNAIFSGRTGTAEPLELHIGFDGSPSLTTRVLRLERAGTTPATTPPNLIGGFFENTVTSGVVGATIGGGGGSNLANQVTGNFGTVGGGAGNTASGTVAATVGGGFGNVASSFQATVGGGFGNVASAVASTVPGGQFNFAAGDFSFAAGQKAKANHNGTFVWADGTDTDFASTAANQFLIRAAGNVGIGTNSPGQKLTVNGTIQSLTGGFKFPDGTIQTSAAAGGAGVPGYEIVIAQVFVSGGAEGTLNAVCPTGKKATGGGFAMGTGLVERENHPAIRPGGDATTFGEAWFVRAFNPTGSQLLITAYAVCATV